jgi:hypothetical protein
LGEEGRAGEVEEVEEVGGGQEGDGEVHGRGVNGFAGLGDTC